MGLLAFAGSVVGGGRGGVGGEGAPPSLAWLAEMLVHARQEDEAPQELGRFSQKRSSLSFSHRSWKEISEQTAPWS